MQVSDDGNFEPITIQNDDTNTAFFSPINTMSIRAGSFENNMSVKVEFKCPFFCQSVEGITFLSRLSMAISQLSFEVSS